MADKSETAWPTLPSELAHRISMRWLTLESLRVLLERQSHGVGPERVLLFTGAGVVEGELTDIADTYEESVDSANLQVDVASATAHMRTDLWHVLADKDGELEPVDTAPIVRLQNAVIHTSNSTIHTKELAVFANEVIGFTTVRSSIWNAQQ